MRRDVFPASKRSKTSLASLAPAAISGPTLAVIRTSIFGAALRDLPDVSISEVEAILKGISGNFAVLFLPSLDPPQLSAVIRAMEGSAPPRKPITPEEIKKALEEKSADPATPGRGSKRMREILHPEPKSVGALIEGKALLPPSIKEASQLPHASCADCGIVERTRYPAGWCA